MRLHNKKSQWFIYLFSFILIADLLYLAVPHTEARIMKHKVNLSPDIEQNTMDYKPNSHLEGLYYLTVYGETDYFSDIEASLTISRKLSDYKSVIARIFNILLPVVCFGIMITYLGYMIRKKKQQISLMAISIGGHAPPRLIEILTF